MENNKQMSMFGVGPKLFIITSVFFIIALILNSINKELFQINILNRSIQLYFGIILLISGLTLHVICAKTILAVHKQDLLFTSGVFKICRHPMYSAWIFFNLPGIALLFGSWLMFAIPLFMYVIFRILIKREDQYLQNRYTEDFVSYKKDVNLVFPCIWRFYRKT